MIPLKDMMGKSVAVMGLGRSGLCTARALAIAGAEVRAWDDNADRRAAAEAEGLPLVSLLEVDWGDTAVLVLSPGDSTYTSRSEPGRGQSARARDRNHRRHRTAETVGHASTVRRHHRDERQIDDDSIDRKYL